MVIVAILVTLGSTILAAVLAWQVKTVAPEIGAVARYNLLVLPLLYAANVLLGAAFIRAHAVMKNLPLAVAGQSFVYYILLLVLSIFLLGDHLPVGRSVAGFLLIAAGVALLAR